MSAAEIRHWIRELKYTYGWPTACLSRTLGRNGNILGKLSGAWIYVSEQPRFTRQIKRILSGELVPKRIKRGVRTYRWEAVLADNPVPLVTRARMAIDSDLSRGVRIVWRQPPLRPPPVLPSFKIGIERFTEG